MRYTVKHFCNANAKASEANTYRIMDSKSGMAYSQHGDKQVAEAICAILNGQLTPSSSHQIPIHMPRGKYERKWSKPTGEKQQPAKRRYNKRQQLPDVPAPLPVAEGDLPEPDINMPVNISELMLLEMALKKYRESITENFSGHVAQILQRSAQRLEKKVASNAESWVSLHGGKNG